MTWTTVLDVVGAVLLLLGALLCLAGAIGLMRFPDTLSRLHAATKPQTLGLILVLTGLAGHAAHLVCRHDARDARGHTVLHLARLRPPRRPGSYHNGNVDESTLEVDELSAALVPAEADDAT